MDKIIFTCKTITPLVMSGAYDAPPELRPPGIKASLRFWWRALHGHLPLEDRKDSNGRVLENGLRTKEAEIFGSTKGRSKVLIRVKEDIGTETIKHSILPHKGGSIASAFPSNKTFKIQLNCESSQTDMLKNLFILACTLGGWGKRSRRGFGAVEVIEIDGIPYTMPTDLNGILQCIKKVDGEYDIINGSIQHTHPRNENYPWIKEIQIGAATKSTKDIGQITHDVMGENEPQKTNYKYTLGAGSPRFASPIYVSLLSDGRPILTTLKSVSPSIIRKDREKGASVQPFLINSFKSKILNP